MFDTYFEGWEVKPEYQKEYVSLWSGWLGKDNIHKLDEVTELEWKRFNDWIASLNQHFTIQLVDCESESINKVKAIESLISDYETSMDKDDSLFTKIILPELECVITEEWDYTYIIWHKNNGAVETLSAFIKSSGLKHFND